MNNAQAYEGYSTLDAITTAAATTYRHRPAIIAEETWSYSRLNAEATAMARTLAGLGVRKGDRVALRLAPSGRALLLLAAIAKAGASAVPFDVATPASRLTTLSAQAAARLTIDGPAALAAIYEGDHSGPAPEGARPEDEAYVIFTSGSTGAAKGVSVPHSSIAAHACHARNYYGLTTADRVLQFASLGFDVSQEEIWPTWAAGAAVVVNPTWLPDAHRLAEITASHGITVLQLPTAYWRTITAKPCDRSAVAFRGVRMVIVGGEAVRLGDLVAHSASALGHADLVNGYGPTETVVTSVAWRLPAGAPPAEGRTAVPIGAPFPGRQVAVVQVNGELAGLGQEGELWVAGLLANGYVGLPDQTAERFTTPAGDNPALAGHRWYKTGDRVLVLPDGQLAFAGRLDEQVKLRGYRIELGEVDAALSDTGLVTGAATALIERDGMEPLLGALVVPKGAFHADSLVAPLRERLPAAFIPALWAHASAIPLTPSGKVDRTACGRLIVGSMTEPRPRDSQPSGAGKDVQMLGALAEVWREVLGVEDAAPDSNFFEVGGDSLLAVRFAARARAKGIVIRPADVVRQGTLGRIAATAQWQTAAAAGREVAS